MHSYIEMKIRKSGSLATSFLGHRFEYDNLSQETGQVDLAHTASPRQMSSLKADALSCFSFGTSLVRGFGISSFEYRRLRKRFRTALTVLPKTFYSACKVPSVELW